MALFGWQNVRNQVKTALGSFELGFHLREIESGLLFICLCFSNPLTTKQKPGLAFVEMDTIRNEYFMAVTEIRVRLMSSVFRIDSLWWCKVTLSPFTTLT